jgi:8-oxo-dGTP diphosphatase
MRRAAPYRAFSSAYSLENDLSRDTLAALIAAIEPLDLVEAAHQADALAWVRSNAPLYRIQKPATPPKHLVVYLAVFDPIAQRLLLVDHRNAGLWLPPGGHVEPEEHPRETARREAWEELELHADFMDNEPRFLTITSTVGADAGHTDVTLWYLLRGDSASAARVDMSEFHRVVWFSLDALPYPRTEPHLARFIEKVWK